MSVCRAAARRWYVGRFFISNATRNARNEAFPLMYGGNARKRWISHQAQVADYGAARDEDRILDLCRGLQMRPDSLQVVKDWIDQGNALSDATLSIIYERLIDKKMYVQALKILAGVREESLAEVTQKHCIMEIDLTCLQHGCAKGESLYYRLPEEMKTEEVTKNLLLSFTKHHAISRVERWMQQTEIDKQDVEIWNAVLVMYFNRDRHDKVFTTYKRMKEAGTELNPYSYRILLQSRDRVGGYEEITKDVGTDLEGIELENAELSTLQCVVEAYGYLGKVGKVENVWGIMKERSSLDEESYVSAVRAFGILGDLLKVEEVLHGIVGKPSKEVYSVLVEVYTRNGNMEKAENVLRNNLKEEPELWAYECLITGYIARNEPDSALQKYNEALGTMLKKGDKLRYKTVVSLLKVFASRRDVEAAEHLMTFHYIPYHGDTNLYNELLKVYVAAIRIPRDFRKRMRDQFLELNDETERLLARLPVVPNSK